MLLGLALLDPASAQSVTLWSAGLDAAGTRLIVYYQKDFPGCAVLVDRAGTVLGPSAPFCDSLGRDVLVDEPLVDFAVVAGRAVRLCKEDDLTICSGETDVVSIELQRVAFQGPDLVVTYSGKGNICAHLRDPANYALLHSQNCFCHEGADQSVRAPASDFPTLAPGDPVVLVHGNNVNVGSDIVVVEDLPPARVRPRGTCGTADARVRITDITPYGRVRLYAGSPGAGTVLGGRCAGTALDVVPTGAGTFEVGLDGDRVVPLVGEPCGTTYQGVDLETCRATRLVTF